MGLSLDSWWVDAAHQLEKQRETHRVKERERGALCVSVITCCRNSEEDKKEQFVLLPFQIYAG